MLLKVVLFNSRRIPILEKEALPFLDSGVVLPFFSYFYYINKNQMARMVAKIGYGILCLREIGLRFNKKL
jgi:hypothetical protein